MNQSWKQKTKRKVSWEINVYIRMLIKDSSIKELSFQRDKQCSFLFEYCILIQPFVCDIKQVKYLTVCFTTLI